MAQMSPRFTNAEGGLPDNPPDSVCLHGSNDFPRGIRQQRRRPEGSGA